MLIIGVALSAYLLVLQWQADYGEAATQASSLSDTGSPLQDFTPETPAETPASTFDDFEAPREEFTQPDVQVGDNPVPSPQTPARQENLIRISTDKFVMLIDRRGGDIVGVELRDYKEQLGEDTGLLLLRQDNTRLAIAQSGLIGTNGFDRTVPGRPLYTSEASSYTLGEGTDDTLRVPLRFSQDGVEVVKTFVLKRGQHDIDISFQVNNGGEHNWQAQIFALFKRDGLSPTYERSTFGAASFNGIAFNTASDNYQKIDYEDLNNKDFKETSKGGWVSMVQHYFVASFIPSDPDREYFYSSRAVAGGDYIFGLGTQSFTLPPGESYRDSVKLYLGPKNKKVLDNLATDLALTIDYGWLWYISQPLFQFLDYIHSYVNNWGLAIIIMTFIIKLIFFPLTNASYKSMARMRALQPQMEAIRNTHKDDRRRVQQEVMELYKREKVNPLGGCLPIVIQMPIFIAFYWTLIESVELRHAPLIWWIQDLAALDKYFVLPLLMGASMFVQQLLSPKPADPMQARIMKFLPVVFTIFFLWFPSGLVLYWLVNNVLSVMQQYIIYARLGMLPGKINLGKAPAEASPPATGTTATPDANSNNPDAPKKPKLKPFKQKKHRR